jgi:hypothetical protein
VPSDAISSIIRPHFKDQCYKYLYRPVNFTLLFGDRSLYRPVSIQDTGLYRKLRPRPSTPDPCTVSSDIHVRAWDPRAGLQPQRDASCRMGGNVPAVTAWAGQTVQQAQFHARRSGGRDESASHTGPCISVEPAHVRMPWKEQGHVHNIYCNPNPSTFSGWRQLYSLI